MKLFDIFKKKKPVQQENVPNKKKKVVLDKEMDFPGVKKFDEDRYLADTFEDVFRAIRYDGWKREFTNYGEMHFTKGKVQVKIHFRDNSTFYIKRIELHAGYTTFIYRDELDVDHYNMFYEIYRDFVIADNEGKKKNIEKSMKEINDVLGKDVIRDSKIDMLLNSDEE